MGLLTVGGVNIVYLSLASVAFCSKPQTKTKNLLKKKKSDVQVEIKLMTLTFYF